jgi:hypothetical protein
LRAKQVARHDQLIKVSALCANPVAIGWMSARTAAMALPPALESPLFADAEQLF